MCDWTCHHPRDWPLQQLDVRNAFLNGNINKIVSMKQPPGFENTCYPNRVYALKKALYGLFKHHGHGIPNWLDFFYL